MGIRPHFLDRMHAILDEVDFVVLGCALTPETYASMPANRAMPAVSN